MYCLRCAAPLGRPYLEGFRRIGGLTTALTVLLFVDCACVLLAIPMALFVLPEVLLSLACMVLVIVWLYRARCNVETCGVRHRRSSGWAIGGWFCPVVFFWFPLQVVLDAALIGDGARVAADEARSRRMAWYIGAWWTCWLLSWFTGFHERKRLVAAPGGQPVVMRAVSFMIGSTPVSEVFLAAAGALLIFVMREINARQTTMRA